MQHFCKSKQVFSDVAEPNNISWIGISVLLSRTVASSTKILGK